MGAFNQKEFNKFVKENNVYGFFTEPITTAAGRKTHFYVNWRTIVEDAYLTDVLSDFVLSFTQTNNISVDTFYGVPEGATKLGVITQFKLAKQSSHFAEKSHTLSMGRAKPKEHGVPKDKFFVGMPKGNVVVLEDVTTTGGSLIKALEKLKNAGVHVVAVISLTNRMEKRDDGKSVKEKITKLGYDFYSMSSSLDILPIIYAKESPDEQIGRAIEKEFEQYGVRSLTLIEAKHEH